MKEASYQRFFTSARRLGTGSPLTLSAKFAAAIVLLFGMAFSTPLYAQPLTALVLGGGSTPSAADAAVTNRLGMLGFDVTYMDDNVATSNDAVAFDLLVTLASGNSGEYSRYKEVPVPILNTEQAAQQESRYSMVTAGRGTANNQIAADIVGAGHPLSFGLSGVVTVFEPAEAMTFGTPEPNATVIATLVDNSAQACIYAYEAGDVMAFGFVAPAARMQFMLSDNSFLSLTEDGLKLFDAAALWLTGQTSPEAPPLISDVSPANGASFQPANVDIGFTTSTHPSNSIPNTTDNIKMFLDGVDVSADLLVTGTATNRNVSYTNDLAADKLYQVKVAVTDDSGREGSRIWSFDTFVESSSLVIEAENFNFDADQYINDPGISYTFPPTTNYYGQGYENGIPDVDYHELDPLTRPASGVEWRWLGLAGLPQTAVNSDDLRQAYFDAGVQDFDLVNIQAGEWANYTKDFADGNYQIYLRALSGPNQTVQLHLVTSDATVSNQTTLLVGSFNITRSGGGGYGFTALTQPDGSPTVLHLSGTQTLRLTAVTADNDLNINYIRVVPTTDQPTVIGPYVENVSPEPGSTAALRNGITATITDRQTSVDTNSIVLLVDDVAVSAGLTVTGTATGADVSYTVSPPFAPDSAHTVELRYSDDQANLFTNTWSFSTSPDALPVFAAARMENGELKLLAAYAAPVDPTTATSLGNYSSDQGITFSAVSNLTDRAVELTGSPVVDGQSYLLTVENVEDTFGNVVPSTSISYNISPFMEEANGSVVFEAESYYTNVAGVDVNTNDTAWEFSGAVGGYSGGGSMHASDGFAVIAVSNVTAAARMDYRVRFTQPGNYKVWIRGIESAGAEAGADSCHFGIDGVYFGAVNGIAVGNFNWNDDLVPGTGANSFNVPAAGDYTINVWVREDGFYLDKIMLVLESADFDPTTINGGFGPDQSPRVGDAISAPTLLFSQPSAGEIQFDWTGTGLHLEQSPQVAPPAWSVVPGGNTPPFTLPMTNDQMYFRLSDQ